MDETFDREKVVDCMFDSVTSSILAELEDGEKECSFLAQQSSISESEVLERLSYLIEHEFISKNSDDGKCLLAANFDKLSALVENSENFDAAIDSLEKMDTYLNWSFSIYNPVDSYYYQSYHSNYKYYHWDGSKW